MLEWLQEEKRTSVGTIVVEVLGGFNRSLLGGKAPAQ
jgi:hypothetical protein